MESYQRVQAMILLQDMVGRINANRNVASCYTYTNAATGLPYLGVGATAATPPCASGSASQKAQAIADLASWNALLQGSAETAGGNNAGAMAGARGCISYNAASELTSATGAAIAGTGIYTISTAWQGLGATFANTTELCGKDLYGDERQRRVATLTFRIASLL
jgi:type IV pilus assembly protein PilV